IGWDDSATRLSTVLRAVSQLGYRATPYDAAARERLARAESRKLLLRTALAWLAMMQVMMFAVPAYVSSDGVEPEYERLLQLASRSAPEVADRCVDFPRTHATASIAASLLVPGDHVSVSSGAVLPADGIVVEGRSSVEEAILSGESWPRSRAPGDTVLAGSI